jgi:hypothetical protein
VGHLVAQRFSKRFETVLKRLETVLKRFETVLKRFKNGSWRARRVAAKRTVPEMKLPWISRSARLRGA